MFEKRKISVPEIGNTPKKANIHINKSKEDSCKKRKYKIKVHKVFKNHVFDSPAKIKVTILIW